MEIEVLEQRLATMEAYNAALLTAVQTLIGLQPDQRLARAAIADSMDRLIASTLAHPTSEAFLAVLQGLQRQLPPAAAS